MKNTNQFIAKTNKGFVAADSRKDIRFKLREMGYKGSHNPNGDSFTDVSIVTVDTEKSIFKKTVFGDRGRLEVELKNTDEGFRFSVCGNIGRSWGQCCGEVGEKNPENKTIQRLVKLWEKYHLNDMKAGTPEQEGALKAWKALGNKYDYDAACNFLKSIDLYEVYFENGEKYIYGHKWLFNKIPDVIVQEIIFLLS